MSFLSALDVNVKAISAAWNDAVLEKKLVQIL